MQDTLKPTCISIPIRTVCVELMRISSNTSSNVYILQIFCSLSDISSYPFSLYINWTFSLNVCVCPAGYMLMTIISRLINFFLPQTNAPMIWVILLCHPSSTLPFFSTWAAFDKCFTQVFICGKLFISLQTSGLVLTLFILVPLLRSS